VSEFLPQVLLLSRARRRVAGCPEPQGSGHSAP